MAKDLVKLFTSLGLSESETRIYLASLELGPTSVQEIAKKAKLSRTAAYDAIASLQDRGLISTVEKGKKRLFAAEDPERVAAHFRANMFRMQDQLDAFSKILPELQLQVGGARPAVRFYEGEEGLRALFHDVAKLNPKNLDELSNFDDIYSHLDFSFVNDLRQIIKPEKVNYRILHRGKLKGGRPNIEYCELLPELGDFHGDIWIYEDRVAFVTFVGKVMVVIIESKTFADTARVLFEAAWRVCASGGRSYRK